MVVIARFPFQGLYHFVLLSAMYKNPYFSRTLPLEYVLSLQIFAVYQKRIGILAQFYFVFLMSVVEHLFIFKSNLYFSMDCLFLFLAHFLMGLFFLSFSYSPTTKNSLSLFKRSCLNTQKFFIDTSPMFYELQIVFPSFSFVL